MRKDNRTLPGFTLIEILVVVALIAILAAITIIAINPQQNFQDARNTQRQSDATQILNAVTQYTAQQGNLLADLGTIPNCTPGPAADIGTGTGNVDLAANLVPDFLVAIPQDPQTGTAADTGYDICTTGSGRVQIDAPDAEGTTISVQR
ncbi:MAG: prepilin-type N-terminal cleavage/methylation domain-containing protein [Candidatus Dojkabacteria bacterium]